LRYPGAGPAFPDHHIIYKGAIVFLAMNPTQYGYTLVAPKEQVAGDFTVDLQRVVHRVAETVREEVGAERMHVLSIGSNQSNAHVHWHVVPLPPGTPYEGQQFSAVRLETAGALRIQNEETAALATRIGQRMESP
jgi:diadenosine tetraphosphate (Ap4A) HIT family hydrolase